MDTSRLLISAVFITLSGALTMSVNDLEIPLQLHNIQTQFMRGIKNKVADTFSNSSYSPSKRKKYN